MWDYYSRAIVVIQYMTVAAEYVYIFIVLKDLFITFIAYEVVWFGLEEGL